MAKKRKTKKKKPEKERYEIEVEDWDADYRFGLNTGPKDLVEGVYWEYSRLVLTGKSFHLSLKKPADPGLK